jgi:hypothetical protein
LKLRIAGLSNWKIKTINDDGENGYEFTFSAGGKNYEGTCWPDDERVRVDLEK